MPKTKANLGQMALKHLRALEAGKRAYQRAERLLDKILERAKVGESFALPDGDEAIVKDLYAETNRVYRAHGITRYEVVRIDGVTGKPAKR